MSSTARPLGVTVIVILQVLLGVLALVGGLGLFFSGLVLPEIFPRMLFLGARSSGFALTVLAVIDLVLAIGLWGGSRWAWMAALIFAVLGISASVILLFLRPRVGQFFSLIFNLAVLYYLMQPRVQSYFGRISTKAPMGAAS